MATYVCVLPVGRSPRKTTILFLLIYPDLLDGLTTHVDHSANFLRLPHPRTGAFQTHSHPSFLTTLKGIASLFLPVKGPKDTPGDVSIILEVQAVSPAEARSWFLDNEVVSGERMVVVYICPISNTCQMGGFC
jgi:hypothetical protein